MGTKLTRKIRGLNSSFLGKDKWGNALKGRYRVTLLSQSRHQKSGANPGPLGRVIPFVWGSFITGAIPFWSDSGNLLGKFRSRAACTWSA